MRYRQDVPPGTDLHAVARHVVAHLAGAVHPHDDPTEFAEDVRVTVHQPGTVHDTMIAVVGEIDGEPDAPYLRPDYSPDTDHADIEFRLYENPDAERHADHQALLHFREGR
jgi:hypothetical protein